MNIDEQNITYDKELLKKLIKIYTLNHDFVIKTEEYFEDLNLYIAPVIEHRAALHHICNSFQHAIDDNKEDSNAQLKKAVNHEMRAFYDIADLICIKIREKIGKDLNKLKPKQIKKIGDIFFQARKVITDLSYKVASIRIGKDDLETKKELLDQKQDSGLLYVEKYANLVDNALNFYLFYLRDIEHFILTKTPVDIKTIEKAEELIAQIESKE